jgi:chromosome partitioning protein
MLKIAITNLKGGSAKTTSTAYLAHALAQHGRNVLVVDADPQGSALRWSEVGEWEIPTIGLPVKDLHNRLPGIVPNAIDVVIIDTPPLAEQAGVVRSALRYADLAIVTIAPTMLEFERLPDVWEAIDDLDALDQAPQNVRVLLTRTITNARSTALFRSAIEAGGNRVLDTVVGRRESIAQSFGERVTELGPYAAVAVEVLELEANL